MLYKFLSNNEHHNIVIFIFTVFVYLSGDIDNRFPNKTEIWVKAIVWEYPEKTTDLSQVVSTTPRIERGSISQR
jgi:hypothetical protein